VFHLALLLALAAQPQKIRTFHDFSDASVPQALKESAQFLPARAAASDGAIWQAQTIGLVRIDRKAAVRDQYQYFAGKRYLPDDDVQNLLPDAAAGMWVRTKTGISHIELKPMTLAQKAEIFEERIRLRHDRHGLVSPSNLRIPGDLSTNQMRDDDNDGLWTSMYAAGECFRYAVTKSPEALANALKATDAVLFLEEVSGKRGFPARSFIRKGEPVSSDGEWHWTADGEYDWKGDTSSDEIVGHMFLYSIATDLLPDAELKKHIVETTARIMDRILQNGYDLVDAAGKPTTWGKWSPAYLEKAKGDSPLNSLELLSFLKSAAHITGSRKYQREYKKVALKMGYAQLSTRYLQLREEINYSDEELAMLAFYGLFRYESDTKMREQYYGPALNAWWQNEAREENPLWTFIYGAAHPKSSIDMESAARTLYRMPLDTIDWRVRNSYRKDLLMDNTLDRFQHRQARTKLPPDELPAMKWNGNPFVIDSDSEGHSEDDGAAFLLPYWMGRYYGFLAGEI